MFTQDALGPGCLATFRLLSLRPSFAERTVGFNSPIASSPLRVLFFSGPSVPVCSLAEEAADPVSVVSSVSVSSSTVSSLPHAEEKVSANEEKFSFSSLPAGVLLSAAFLPSSFAPTPTVEIPEAESCALFSPGPVKGPQVEFPFS